ncbi:DUF732 domain-containing protein [Dietzia alimentaria]|uniref:DUF732 domain-containing protein n=1 Tax=Dietzia alimentaria TaxID=665550 RepID=UPI00029B33B1|nr:DUF732 domain-containing protein [Dietzia alimentaria]
MTFALRRVGVGTMVLLTAITMVACNSDHVEGAPEASRTTTGPATVTAGASPASAPADTTSRWSPAEREFLDDLSGFGFPTDMTASTTVEVGIGICHSIADGADDDTILDRIRPLTSAIAAQHPDRESAEVGQKLIDASRTRLCE